nr:16S rRNA processing protein RimM [Desulfuromonadales bacterium]
MTVGTCGKAHGIKGELAVFTGAPEVFVPGAVIHTEQGTLTVDSARTHNDRLLVRFEGIADRTAADAMRNVELAVDADDLPALAENEYWVASLIDRPVRTTSGETLGFVKSVELGPQDRLVIGTDNGEFEIPFVAALVPEVAADYIVVDPPPGLIDLA